jgi:hypothetical protein
MVVKNLPIGSCVLCFVITVLLGTKMEGQTPPTLPPYVPPPIKFLNPIPIGDVCHKFVGTISCHSKFPGINPGDTWTECPAATTCDLITYYCKESDGTIAAKWDANPDAAQWFNNGEVLDVDNPTNPPFMKAWWVDSWWCFKAWKCNCTWSGESFFCLISENEAPDQMQLIIDWALVPAPACTGSEN